MCTIQEASLEENQNASLTQNTFVSTYTDHGRLDWQCVFDLFDEYYSTLLLRFKPCRRFADA